MLVPLNSQAWLMCEEWVGSKLYLAYLNLENPLFHENGAYLYEALPGFLVV